MSIEGLGAATPHAPTSSVLEVSGKARVQTLEIHMSASPHQSNTIMMLAQTCTRLSANDRHCRLTHRQISTVDPAHHYPSESEHERSETCIMGDARQESKFNSAKDCGWL
jgi:hypothetical protein